MERNSRRGKKKTDLPSTSLDEDVDLSRSPEVFTNEDMENYFKSQVSQLHSMDKNLDSLLQRDAENSTDRCIPLMAMRVCEEFSQPSNRSELSNDLMENLIMKTSSLSVFVDTPSDNISKSSSTNSSIDLGKKSRKAPQILSELSSIAEHQSSMDSIHNSPSGSWITTQSSRNTGNNSYGSEIGVDMSEPSEDEGTIENDSSEGENNLCNSREHSLENMETPPSPPRPKKIQRVPAVPAEWKKNKRRTNRNKGQAYVGHKNKPKPEREVKEACECNRRCSRRFKESERKKLKEDFWHLGCFNRRRELIAKLVMAKPCAKSRVNGNSKRKFTRIYQLKKGRRYIQVCQVFFLNTLDIGEKMVQVALQKAERSSTGALSPDRRGYHAPANKISAERIARVHEHINLLPIVPPHLCRRDSVKKYIEGDLNFDELYQLYLDWTGTQGLEPVKKAIYQREFSKLNIEFHQPKKDQCWCATFYKLPLSEQLDRETEYQKHTIMKTETKLEKDKDLREAKVMKDTQTLFFDLEAVLYAPFFYAKPIFYLRKMATFNLTVTEAKQNKVMCYVWDENNGRRGSQEIATCLWRYLDSEIPAGIKYLNLYADNCAGQNKNQTVVSMLGHALLRHPTLQSVQLKFLEAGHTYMPCDTAHSAIEKEGRRTRIDIPQDWVPVIRKACGSNPYTIEQLVFHHFRDFKALKDGVMPKNLKCIDGTSIKWSEVKEFKMERKTPGTIYVKSQFSKPYKKCALKNKLKVTQVGPLYMDELGIDPVKLRDLKMICQKKLIPQEKRATYMNLKSSGDGDGAPNQDGRAHIPGRRGE